MEKIIEVDQVSLVYEGEKQKTTALTDISLSIGRGEYVAVLGHNGSGKSTFVKLLNGILTPTSGKIRIAGYDTSDSEQLWQARRKAGMVFQNPDNQIVATTVEEDVAFGLENIGVPTEQMQERIDAALSAVSMTAFAKKQPHMLSGGQKQRVAIAGILAMQPDIVLLDEATAMLDPKGRRDVMTILGKLNHELGITIVHITHYMEQVMEADRAIVLNQGQVILDGAPMEIFKHPRIREIGLDVPGVIAFRERLSDLIDFGEETSFKGVAAKICQLL